MKNIIIILLLLCSQLSSAQFLESNQLDSLGLKQGTWKEYKLIPSKVIVNKAIEDSIDGVRINNDFDLLDDPVIFTSQGNYINGLKNGTWVEFWLNGNIRSKVNYLNGVALGEFKYYYSTGIIQMEGTINLSAEIMVSLYNKHGEFLRSEKEKTISILEFLYLK